MPTLYINSLYGAGSGPYGNLSDLDGWVQSPLTRSFSNHHVMQREGKNINVGREVWDDFATKRGDYFHVNRVRYIIRRIPDSTTSLSMAAKIFSGNLTTGYEALSWSNLVTVNDTLDKKTFTGFSTKRFLNGNYQFGVWVSATSGSGLRWGVLSTSNSDNKIRIQNKTTTVGETFLNASTGAQNLPPSTKSGGATVTNPVAYMELEYFLPPLEPGISATFNNSGVITVVLEPPSDNGGTAITGYAYRWREFGGTWSQRQNVGTTLSQRTFTINGEFGQEYEIQAAAQNIVSTNDNKSNDTGAIAVTSIDVIGTDFRLKDRPLANGIVGVVYEEKIVAETKDVSANVTFEWVNPKNRSEIVDGPKGITVSPGEQTILGGTPEKSGKHELKLRMTGTNQEPETGFFPLTILPKINIFTGGSWTTAKEFLVYNGNNWVSPETFKVFNGLEWVDPRK
jgi:hypothetical protein